MPATATATKARKGGVVALKTSPYEKITLSKLPEIVDGRSRTNFGWEDLTKPKDAKRIPANKIDAARTSITNYSNTHMNEDGSGPRYTVMPELDKDGQVIPLKREVNGEMVIEKDGRGNIKPAGFLVVRVNDYAPGQHPRFVAGAAAKAKK